MSVGARPRRRPGAVLRVRGRPPRSLRSRLPSAAVGAAALSLFVAPESASSPPGGSSAVAADAPAAQARSWVVEGFDADIVVLERGEVVVTETIALRFRGSFNGIVRLIPIEYRTPRGGFEYDLRLTVEEVTDAGGTRLRHEIGRERHYRSIKVWIPGAEDATRTIALRYRVERGLRFHDEYDELYWNVTGDEWPVPIERARARVHLPEGVTGVRATAFTGPYGATGREAAVEVDGRHILVRATRPLDMWEGLTLGVAWDPGVVDRPTTLDAVGWFLQANWLLLLPFLALGGMLRHWRQRGRDPEIGSVAAEYGPPDGLTPGEVGVVIDDAPDLRDVTATVVDLAVRGHLRIEELEEKKLLGLLTDRDYRLERRTPAEAWQELLPHERALLRALFDGGGRASVRISDLENEFYEDLPDIRDRLLDSLLRHGVYERRPDRVKAVYLGLGVLAAALIAVPGLAGAERLGLARATVIVAALATGAVIAGLGRWMPVRTAAGARMVRKVRGFEEFLRRVESDRFRRMITGPEMFEKYLPFAMALGVEGKWAAAFDDLYREPPEWYRGGDARGFRARVFAADLGRMSARTASAMASRPRSSGGSSFGGGGGGGFSGGGFGGGGGRAF